MIGSLLSLIGTIIGFVVWRKQSTKKQTKIKIPIFAIIGWILAIISLVFIPVLFGSCGIIFGLLHRRINVIHGNLIIFMSIAFALPGSIISILIEELMG